MDYDILMIVRNEVEGIQVTLNSIPTTYSGRIFIYDTGSTDETIAKALEMRPNQVITSAGQFDNFSQARNAAQCWAATYPNVDWVLWLDANDEMVNEPVACDDNANAYLIAQQWTTDSGNITEFYNYRLFRQTDVTIWRGYVHEWIELPPAYHKPTMPVDKFCIKQNRSRNCESSQKRWKRDVELLTRQVEENPTDSRGYFYLGRAYKDIGEVDNAIKWLTRRLDFTNFPEERYWTKYYLAELESEWRKKCAKFIEAYGECGRIEALIAATRLYNDHHCWYEAYMCASTAASLPQPTDAILFLHKEDYTYWRWHLLGICAYYVNQKDVGKHACETALVDRGAKIDESNLKWYK